MTPKPELETFEGVFDEINKRNQRVNAALPPRIRPIEPIHPELTSATLNDVLAYCIIGLSHIPDLAERRMQSALESERLSRDRLYQQSFVEATYYLGPLAVIAFTAMDDSQPEEWVVESFLGDSIEPRVDVLEMVFPTIFGVDVRDQANLNIAIEAWYPSTPAPLN